MKPRKLFVFLFFLLIIICSAHTQIKSKKATSLFEQGRFKEALEYLLKENSNPEVNYSISVCYLNLLQSKNLTVISRQRYLKDLMVYLEKMDNDPIPQDMQNKLVQLMNDTKIILNNYGIKYYNDEKLKSALSSLMAANELEGEMGRSDTTLLYTIGVIGHKLKETGIAIKSLENCISQGMTNIDAYYILIEIYEQEDNEDDLLRILGKAGSIYPNNTNLINKELNLYIETNRYREAIDKIEKASPPNKFNQSLWLLKASLFNNLGESMKAEEAYLFIFEKGNENIQALLGIGNFYLEQGILFQDDQSKAEIFYKKSLGYLDKAYQLYPDEIEVLKPLSQLYSLMGEFEKYNLTKKKLEMMQ